MRSVLMLLAASLVLAAVGVAEGQTISGVLNKWETVTLDFEGPDSFELSGRAQVDEVVALGNPFLDYRLQVEFTSPTGNSYVVPGFFDGDGQGGASGDVWRTRFTPDEVGDWTYTASFRQGFDIAVNLDPLAGTPASSIDGASGGFSIADTAANAEGSFQTGRLEYVGSHYLKQRDGGYWIKTGADSPENFLGYRGFDNTQTKGNDGPGRRGILHNYGGHAGDWNPGDPAWDTPDFDFGNTLAEGGDARNLIGYLNYLSEIGVNSQYFLASNIGGDGQDSNPFAAISTPAQLSGESNSGVANDNLHYDLSKLAQWETVFRHAQEQGIHLHFVLNEAENANKLELDDGTLGVERKLYYRELVARFGHHNSLQWNLSEEYDLNNGFGPNTAAEAARINEFADYLSALDPYDHPLTVHNAGNNNFANAGQIATNSTYQYFIPDEDFDLTSLQRAGQEEGWSDVVEAFRTATANAGRPLAIMVDEPESITRIGVGTNDDTEPGTTNAERFNTVRKTMTWDILLSGGAGVEWFIHNADQDVEDQRVYEQVYVEAANARRFLEDNLPFWEMTPDDGLLRNEDSDYGGGEAFAKSGEAYAFYLPDGSNDDGPGQSAPEIDLTAGAGREFLLRWYNPRTGEFEGPTAVLTGGDWASVGVTPDGFQNTNDWAGLVTLIGAPVAGDYNRDGVVDAADYTLWRDTEGDNVAPGEGADGDGDGVITQADYVFWADRYGTASSFVVPEPATVALLTLLVTASPIRRPLGR